jgi:hypothetical protein
LSFQVFLLLGYKDGFADTAVNLALEEDGRMGMKMSSRMEGWAVREEIYISRVDQGRRFN